MNSTNQETKLKTLSGPWSLGEITGNWRDIDLPDHVGVMRIVWKMEDDEGSNAVLEAQAHAVVAALNAASLSTPPAEQQAAPKAAPGEQNTVPAEWLEQAYREGWAACRDAETIGEEAEDWAFGNSTANSRMIDAQQAAPQQEAQGLVLGGYTLPPLSEPDLRDVGTKPQDIKDFLRGYATEYARLSVDAALAARKQGATK